MKKVMKYAGVIAALILMAILVLYISNDIGIPKASIERDARTSQAIVGDWQAAKETTQTMSAMIFYSDDLNEHTYSIYVNRPGLSFGYFFRAGGSVSETEQGVAEFHMEGYNERAFISMNKQQINKVEIDDGSSVKTIEIDSEKPFAFILPVNAGNITIYDRYGNVIEGIPHYE